MLRTWRCPSSWSWWWLSRITSIVVDSTIIDAAAAAPPGFGLMPPRRLVTVTRSAGEKLGLNLLDEEDTAETWVRETPCARVSTVRYGSRSSLFKKQATIARSPLSSPHLLTNALHNHVAAPCHVTMCVYLMSRRRRLYPGNTSSLLMMAALQRGVQT